MKTEKIIGEGVENSPNQRLISTHELALEWFNTTLTADQRTKKLLKYGLLGSTEELVIKSIEEIWRKETKLDSIEKTYGKSNNKGNGFQGKIVGNPNIGKPNQKQFKEFNSEYFIKYTDKFTELNVCEMIGLLSRRLNKNQLKEVIKALEVSLQYK